MFIQQAIDQKGTFEDAVSTFPTWSACMYIPGLLQLRDAWLPLTNVSTPWPCPDSPWLWYGLPPTQRKRVHDFLTLGVVTWHFCIKNGLRQPYVNAISQFAPIIKGRGINETSWWSVLERFLFVDCMVAILRMGCGGQERIARYCNRREHETSAMVPLSVVGRITMRPRTDKEDCFSCNVL